MRDAPANPTPPEAWRPLHALARFVRRPLERFLRIQAASGIVLLVVAAGAMVWANSPLAASYHHLWHTPAGVTLGELSFTRSLEWWVNDALMVVFFFVVGMEIRREMHHGELSELRRAALPVVAALGGMAAPALIYALVVGEGPGRAGWGVPMATDIAFAVGVLALLGKRVPPALRVLLLALAVIDDLGAIIIIAAFYSSEISWVGFAVAGLGIAGILLQQAIGVRQPLVYVAPAVVTWAGFMQSGVHPTIAGVIVGLLTPVRAWLGPRGFATRARAELDRLGDAEHVSDSEVSQVAQSVNAARREAVSPAELMIEVLHPWVAFVIMPLFALANAGVSVGEVHFGAAERDVVAGVLAGLVLGKPLGVIVACLVALQLKVAILPAGLSRWHLLVLGLTAGIGFTMALFIAALAFPVGPILDAAKVGVLAASVVAGVLGLVVGLIVLRVTPPVAGQAHTADEAEASTAA